MVYIACTVRPGWFIGTRNSVMPSCLGRLESVRAPTQYQSAKCADVVKIFCPLSTQPSPLRSALSRIAAESDPAPGSEYPTANSISAFRIFGRNSCFSFSEPTLISVLPTMPTPLPMPGAPTADSISLSRYS